MSRLWLIVANQFTSYSYIVYVPIKRFNNHCHWHWSTTTVMFVLLSRFHTWLNNIGILTFHCFLIKELRKNGAVTNIDRWPCNNSKSDFWAIRMMSSGFIASDIIFFCQKHSTLVHTNAMKPCFPCTLWWKLQTHVCTNWYILICSY